MRPTGDTIYLARQINARWHAGGRGKLTPAALQRFVDIYGVRVVEDRVRELHGFPPEEAIRTPYAYLKVMLSELEVTRAEQLTLGGIVKRDAIYIEIEKERLHQRDLWGREHDWGTGDCSSTQVEPIVKAAVLGEECGEVQAAVLDKDDAAIRTELIQVAAVAVAWLEAL